MVSSAGGRGEREWMNGVGGRERSGRQPAVAVRADLLGEPMLLIAPLCL